VSNFVDRAQLHARAGDGGAGAVSFRREAYVDRGGPDGGDGGDGGSVLLRGDPHVSSLVAFRDQPYRRARDGQHGQGQRRHGRRGEDLIVGVPIGTVVRTLDGEIIAEILDTTTLVEVARGGRGGKGNARFLSNRRRAPAFAEQGEPGEDIWLNLELKLVADVALIGPPNVGKSSLLAALTRARPRIGDYPFTTLEPSLGVVRLGSEREFVLADIPGLIEGASEGRGLGHEFLRHAERARVSALVVDAGSADPLGAIRTTLSELESYAASLAERPSVLVVTKADLDPEGAAELGRSLSRRSGIPLAGVVSAHQRSGLDELARALEQAVTSARRSVRGEGVTLLRPRPAVEAEVRRVAPGVFELVGRDALRAVRLSDLGDEAASEVVQRRLESLGLVRILRRLGAKSGDLVRAGDLEFTFEDDLR
jgi:GTP-binding protein